MLGRPVFRLRRPRALARAAAHSALAALALVAGGAAVGAASASAAEYGFSDGRPALFDAAQLKELDMPHVRLVLPWDAARRPGSWDEWLQRATAEGYTILVSPTIDSPHDCQTGSCQGPAVADYAAALNELLAAFPAISSVEAWNEPNHALQPTSRSAALAAHYFDAAYNDCIGRCTAVAGNMLDGGSMPAYLDAYRTALVNKPAVWGIHNYFDATYFQSAGVDKMLSITDGPVWLTETGGLVTFKSPSGTLTYDEHRAADSLRWLFSLAARNPRIQRVYLYGMWQQPWNNFDSALLRVDNTEREGMAVVRAYVGPRRVALKAPDGNVTVVAGDQTGIVRDTNGNVIPSASVLAAISAAATPGATPAAAAAAGTLRVVGKRLALDRRRRATVRLQCVGTVACAGQLEVAAGKWRYRRGVKLAAGGLRTVRVRVPRGAAKHLAAKVSPRAWVTACSAGNSCATSARVGLVTG